MKYIAKLWVRIAVALALGFLFASTTTKIIYPCPLTNGAKGCMSFEKAVMHPNDLRNNKQNSLHNFSMSFAWVSLASFALLSAVSINYKSKNIVSS